MKRKKTRFDINLIIIWLNGYVSNKGIKIQVNLYPYFYIK